MDTVFLYVLSDDWLEITAIDFEDETIDIEKAIDRYIEENYEDCKDYYRRSKSSSISMKSFFIASDYLD